MGTCADAVKEAVQHTGGTVSTKDVINYIHKNYPENPWKEVTIRSHMIGCSVNHTSSKYYPFPKFLFYIGDGKYRMHNPTEDGKWVVDKTGAHLADEPADKIENEEELIEASISFESDLEDYIMRDLGQIENGLKVYKENGVTGQQFSIEIGRIDILAVDKDNNLVVIELKSGTANYHVVGQILSYISWVKKNLSGEKKVRGIIIADDFDDKLKYAVLELPSVRLKKYKVKFEFENV